MTISRNAVAASLLVVTLAVVSCSSGGSRHMVDGDPDAREKLIVTKGSDDGSAGTLRWAIEQSNAKPGRYQIVLIADRAELVIKPTSLLPPIVGPARIRGPWTGTGTPTVGIMILRSRNNHIHHMRFYNNLGAAGVLLTGDDGTAAGGATNLSGRNIVEHSDFLNTSDAIDLARGEEGSIIRFNTMRIDSKGFPSSGIEITNANRDTIEDNTLSGFAEALQIGGTGNTISRNVLTANAVAFSMSAAGNKATGNVVHGNRAGIVINPNHAQTLSRNLVYGNGLDISACAPGNGVAPTLGGVCSTTNWATSRFNVSMGSRTAPTRPNDGRSACADGFADCDGTQNYPVLAGSAFSSGSFVVRGTVETRPNQRLVIEVFASHSSGPDALGDGEVYIGNTEVDSGPTGVASFTFDTRAADPLKDGSRKVYFTATATRVSNGGTSEYSRPELVQAP